MQKPVDFGRMYALGYLAREYMMDGFEQLNEWAMQHYAGCAMQRCSLTMLRRMEEVKVLQLAKKSDLILGNAVRHQ